MQFTASTAVTLSFHFQVDGEFVVPSAAAYSVRNHIGGVVDSGTIDLTASSTQGSVIVSAATNALGDGATFENRVVEVSFISDGGTHVVRKSYRLTPWINISCTEEDVRRELGVLSHEVEDGEIDLVDAYIRVKDWIDVDLDTCLSATDHTNLDANLSIVLYEAVRILPRLRVRISQVQKDDTVTYQRYANLDWGALADDLDQRLELALFGLNQSQVVIEPPTLVVGGSADPVTGRGYPYRRWWRRGGLDGFGFDSSWIP